MGGPGGKPGSQLDQAMTSANFHPPKLPVKQRKKAHPPSRPTIAKPTVPSYCPAQGGRVTAAALLDEPVPISPGQAPDRAAFIFYFALAVVLLAFFSASLGLSGKVSGLPLFLLVYIVLMLAAHAAVRQFAPYADPLLLPLAAVLNGLGIVMIYQAPAVRAGPSNPGFPGIADHARHVLHHDAGPVDRHRRPRPGRGAGADPRGARAERYTYTLGALALL